MASAKDVPILVCGAGGFIGGHLVRSLLEQGHTAVRAADIKPCEKWYQLFPEAENLCLDLTEKDACYHAVEGTREIYNLAADMGGLGFIYNNKSLCMLSVLINTHLLLAARDLGASRFFFASSACVYNTGIQTSNDGISLKESDAYPAMAEDGYGWEKLFSERMCRHFREDFGLATRVARFHNVYGPHETYTGGREKAPAATCRKVAEALIHHRSTIEIWGDGEQTRSFQYIDDCIKGMQMIMHGDHLDPINLGSSEMVSINQLVDYVEEIAGTKLQRTYNLDAPKGVNGRNSDNTLIKEIFGWEPNTELRHGIELTYRWVYDQLARGSSH